MNTNKFLVIGLVLMTVVLSACAPAKSAAVATALRPALVPAQAPLSLPTTAAAPSAIPTPAQTTIASKMFKIPLRYTFGSDWIYDGGGPDSMTLEYRPANLFIDFLVIDHVTVLQSGDPPTHTPFPADFAAYLRANSSFWSAVSAAQPVRMSGVDGVQIDAVGKATAPVRTAFLDYEDSNFKEFFGPIAQKFRFLLFDNVAGKRLLIEIGTEDRSPTSPAQFDAVVAKAQDVLDTIAFGK